MSRTTIDNAGRIVIPKQLRQRMKLEPGDTVELEATEEQITLRPVRAVAPLVKEEGIWVYRSGQPVSEEAIQVAIDAIRDERMAQVLGSWTSSTPRSS